MTESGAILVPLFVFCRSCAYWQSVVKCNKSKREYIKVKATAEFESFHPHQL